MFKTARIKINYISSVFKFQLLQKEQFRCLEKIKTTGSTYMVASGLTAATNSPDFSHVIAVADYAFAIKKQLDYINENSWNTFRLRIGKDNDIMITY